MCGWVEVTSDQTCFGKNFILPLFAAITALTWVAFDDLNATQKLPIMQLALIESKMHPVSLSVVRFAKKPANYGI